jgi:FixJ family two-component response regulator
MRRGLPHLPEVLGHRRTVDGDLSQIQQRVGTLSPREKQVMQLVTAGKMNKQIAGDLGLK